MSVCLSVCLSARSHISKDTRISPNLLYVLPITVAWSSSDDSAIRNVLPVVWMTSSFHIMVVRRQWSSTTTRHPLLDRYWLARSRRETIWLVGAAGGVIMRRGEVCRLWLFCCVFVYFVTLGYFWLFHCGNFEFGCHYQCCRLEFSGGWFQNQAANCCNVCRTLKFSVFLAWTRIWEFLHYGNMHRPYCLHTVHSAAWTHGWAV